MSFTRIALLSAVASCLLIGASATLMAQSKKQPLPPPAHAKSPSPAVDDDYIHKQFGENFSVSAGPPQFRAS
jgi:hypothetical protein